MIDFSPFTYLPPDVCGDPDLPDFPVNQGCAAFDQLRSEVSGLIIRPEGALSPVSVGNLDAWLASYVDNEDPAASHYLVGRGSFLQTEKDDLVLAGGRVEENRERVHRLVFSVVNLDAGHQQFCKNLQSNFKNFLFYMHTLSGRMIWAHSGIRPIFVDAEFVFPNGNDSRASATITIDVEYQSFPFNFS